MIQTANSTEPGERPAVALPAEAVRRVPLAARQPAPASAWELSAVRWPSPAFALWREVLHRLAPTDWRPCSA